MRRVLMMIGILLPGVSAAQSLSGPDKIPVTGTINGSPVTISRSQYWDITSKLNGQTYRIFVWTPSSVEMGGGTAQRPVAGYPVFYILDGNQYFGLATDLLARLSYLKEVLPALVVGIGYPSDDPRVWNQRRALDLTESASPTTRGQSTAQYGGAENFFRLLEDQVKPFVAARYAVDTSKQTLYGQSFGGLFALRVLFRTPKAFSTYVGSSPSIWWNDRELLAYEDTFAKQVRSGEVRAKVLLTSAGDEQYRGSDPAQLAAAQRNRQVDNASELAGRLASLHPGLYVVRTIFDGETHNSVPASSLTRGLRFALSPD